MKSKIFLKSETNLSNNYFGIESLLKEIIKGDFNKMSKNSLYFKYKKNTWLTMNNTVEIMDTIFYYIASLNYYMERKILKYKSTLKILIEKNC